MKKRFAVLNVKVQLISRICAALFVCIGLSLGGASVQAQTSAARARTQDGAKPSPTPKPTQPPKPDKPSPTPKPPKPSPTPKPPKPTPTPKPGKCVVCEHKDGKNKEKNIDCDKVDDYLQSHPDATRGPCVPTPVTNP